MNSNIRYSGPVRGKHSVEKKEIGVLTAASVYSEEKAQAEEAAHKQTMKKYGESLLKHFQEEVESQRRISWDIYTKSREHLAKIGTDNCFMTEAKFDRGLAGKRKAQVREILKTNFKCWEERAGWNQKIGSNGDEYSDDGSIQKFCSGKLLKHGSTDTPDKIVWPSVHQP